MSAPAMPSPSPEDDVRAAAERLVAELRDDCSEVGVSARGLNMRGFEAGVRAFARQAKRHGTTIERMLVLLVQCLRDERLPEEHRDQYEALRDLAVGWAMSTYRSAE
jgi:hypothetical protein